MSKDLIEQSIMVNAPIDKVFRSIATANEWGQWFSDSVEGEFEVGEQPVIDEGKYGKFRIAIVGKEAPSYFAYRWVSGSKFIPDGFLGNPLEHPHTLVEFFLTEEGTQTKVTVKETGFASLPEDYREQAYKDNTGGWEYQLNQLIKFHNGEIQR
jgi:uncharacterized protein YndB with AHSA1/START domain